ncbi:protein lin-41-like [Stylophora pistillata]|uniref:protein lin-41-like n=1 Tax=Stylophora pistillata TaxID=50429 RepID=UPI000C049528|nr:protein lin-41-like [Stylophora pistillata]
MLEKATDEGNSDALSHQRHEFDLIENAVEEDRKHIISNVETIKEKANFFRAEIRKLDKTSKDAEMIIETAKQEVSEAAELVITKTRQQKKQLLESLEMTRRKRTEQINSAKQKLESLVKEINQAAEFAENLVQRTSDFKLGFIQLNEDAGNAAKSTLEGLDQTFQAGVEVELTLCPTPSGAENSYQVALKDQVELLIKPAKDVTNVIVQEKEDGNIRLKFSPKEPGAYSVEVKIDGEKLPTCPFTLPVKERELVVVGELNLHFIKGQELKGSSGIAVNKQGDIAVVDNLGHCVFVFNKEGNCLRQIGKEGTDPGRFKYPTGVSFLNDNEILIADQLNDRIQHINIKTQTVLKIFGQKGEGKGHLQKPLNIFFDDTKRLIVTESKNQRVQVMSKESETMFTIGDNGPEKLSKPYSCISYKDIFLVSERYNHCIKAFDSLGTFLFEFGEKGKQDGQFNTPRGMCLDGSNNLLVCDCENNRVQQFSLDRHFTVEENRKHIMSNVETIKEKANFFRVEIRKLDKTSRDVEMIIEIAKHKVSEAAEHVITKTRQQQKQLFEFLLQIY